MLKTHNEIQNHSSNPDIRPRRMIVLLDVESHTMGYKDHSSNLDICPRRMTILPDAESMPWATRTILLIWTYVLEE
jgi:hypothetical protein